MALIVTPGYLEARGAFYQQLGSLQGAGLGLIESLQTVEQNPPRRSVVKMVPIIISSLQRGQTFGEALHEATGHVPDLDVALLEAGEKTGRLDQVFHALAKYYSERGRLLRKMLSGFAYPIFVLHFALLIFPTTLLSNLVWKSEIWPFVANKLGLFVPLYTGVFLLLLFGNGRWGARWKSAVEEALNIVPLLGAARRSMSLARLALTMEALVSAGVNISEAWILAGRSSGSPRLMRSTARLPAGIAAGRTPGEMLPGIKVIPSLFCNLYRTAETTGDLDNTLTRLQIYYQDQASRQFETIVNWTPRLLYLAIVLYVAWSILSFYTGYFNDIQNAIGS